MIDIIAQKMNDEKYRHLFRFGVTGCLNTLVDFLMFSLLSGPMGIHFSISQVGGYSAGTLNSYIFNKFWTFGDRKGVKKTQSELVQFIVINALSLGISLLGLQLLIDNLGLHKLVSKLFVTLLAQVVNFCGYKFLVFSK